jgi:hypothetical protein
MLKKKSLILQTSKEQIILALFFRNKFFQERKQLYIASRKFYAAFSKNIYKIRNIFFAAFERVGNQLYKLHLVIGFDVFLQSSSRIFE